MDNIIIFCLIDSKRNNFNIVSDNHLRGECLCCS
jgi:hypothetical protein